MFDFKGKDCVQCGKSIEDHKWPVRNLCSKCNHKAYKSSSGSGIYAEKPVRDRVDVNYETDYSKYDYLHNNPTYDFKKK